jgi:hypothetical protein
VGDAFKQIDADRNQRLANERSDIQRREDLKLSKDNRDEELWLRGVENSTSKEAIEAHKGSPWAAKHPGILKTREAVVAREEEERVREGKKTDLQIRELNRKEKSDLLDLADEQGRRDWEGRTAGVKLSDGGRRAGVNIARDALDGPLDENSFRSLDEIASWLSETHPLRGKIERAKRIAQTKRNFNGTLTVMDETPLSGHPEQLAQLLVYLNELPEEERGYFTPIYNSKVASTEHKRLTARTTSYNETLLGNIAFFGGGPGSMEKAKAATDEMMAAGAEHWGELVGNIAVAQAKGSSEEKFESAKNYADAQIGNMKITDPATIIALYKRIGSLQTLENPNDELLKASWGNALDAYLRFNASISGAPGSIANWFIEGTTGIRGPFEEKEEKLGRFRKSISSMGLPQRDIPPVVPSMAKTLGVGG